MMPSTAIVTLKEINRENLDDILSLKVSSKQEKFIASNAVSIAQAHFYPEVAWFRAIYADETPVGFVMLADNPVDSTCDLWRLMIDEGFQKRGFGRCAMKLILQHLKTRPQAKISTSCVCGNGSPKEFYKKIGFIDTGDIDEDGELIMIYKL